jgi:LysR family transcriptional activator of dmlA
MHNLPTLSDLRLICEVMRQGSLAATATALGASPSFVSKRLALLEANLGTRLLHRTTRRIVFTDDGETVYRWAQRILADVDGMAEELSVSGGTPQDRCA